MADARRLDAASIVGLLADDDRRRVFAAIELGARGIEAVADVTGLPSAKVAKAAGRLAEVGLVVQSSGALVVADGVFRDAAREALAKPQSDEHEDVPEIARKVMSAFVRDGRLQSIPTSQAKRMVILDWLAQDFEPGERYTEQMVNLVIDKRHADTAALRRYLVDHEFLTREAGVYWRSGGSTVEPTGSAPGGT
jgi:hypothetical protein